MYKFLAIAAIAATMVACTNKAKETTAVDSYTVVIGSYSEPGDTALRVFTLDMTDTTATYVGALPIGNASYFTDLTDSGMIYAVSEKDSADAAVVALRWMGTSAVPEIVNRQPVRSGAPCYIATNGTIVATADYNGATATIFPLAGDSIAPQSMQIRFTGSGSVADRQDTPHPHCIAFTPDGLNMLVDDLGTDRIHSFPLVDGVPDTTHMTDVVITPGNGPRHIVFNAQGAMAYLINEVSDSVTVLSYADGKLTPVQYIAADTVGAHGAGDIHLTPDGRFLYASLRLKNDGIAAFSVDPTTGLLTHIGHTPTAPHPRNFTLSPDGELMFVASRDGNVIEIFAIDKATGALTPTGKTIDVPRPACIRLFPN